MRQTLDLLTTLSEELDQILVEVRDIDERLDAVEAELAGRHGSSADPHPLGLFAGD